MTLGRVVVSAACLLAASCGGDAVTRPSPVAVSPPPTAPTGTTIRIVLSDGSMMNSPTQGDAPSEFERRHAAIAYSRARGNLDVDRDPQQAGASAAPLRAID
jgi:hypothetical protein